MLRILPGLLLSLFLMNTSAQSLRVMSYNIRYDNPADGPNAWSNRRDFLVTQVRTADPDILGVQESLPAQVEYLVSQFPAYGHAGQGRDENGTGESATIFFRMDRFEMTESGTFWLSETPEKMSKGWDAAIRRICTFVRLRDKITQQSWLVLNTHFDHVGVLARQKSAELLTKKILELVRVDTNAPDYVISQPIVLMGDFNATPESLPVEILKRELSDARLIADHVSIPQKGSYNAFNTSKFAEDLIDHIFVSRVISVADYRLIVESRDGRYASDHFPVVIDLQISPDRR